MSASEEAQKPSWPWPPSWHVVALAVLVVAAYHDVLHWMVTNWKDNDDLSYAFLVVPGVGYIVLKHWRESGPRQASRSASVAGMVICALCAAGGLGLTWVGKGGGAGLTLVVLLWGLILHFWGWRSAWQLTMPMGLLLLTNPKFADLLMFTLTWRGQLCSSAGAAMMAGLCGLNVRREGVNIHLPDALIGSGGAEVSDPTGLAHVTIIVAKECSGVRTFLGVLALVAILACLARCDWWRKAALCALAMPVALLINTLRLTIIVFIGHLAGQEAAGVWHLRLMLPTAVVAAVAAIYCGTWIGCTPWESGEKGPAPSEEAAELPGEADEAVPPASASDEPERPVAADDELELD